MPKARIDLPTKLRISDAIKSVIRHIGNGRIEYINGCSDKSIGLRFGVSEWTVRDIRKQMHGQIEPPMKNSMPYFELVSKLNDALHRIEKLEDIINRQL